MAGLRVALLTQERPWGRQKCLEIRPVWCMAIQTILADWRVLEQKRPTFVGMAGKAQFVDTIGLEKRCRCRTVWIMAVGAAYLAFRQRHVGAFVELRSLLFVALGAGLIDRLSGRKSVGRKVGHRVVAVAAAEVVGLVDRAVPEDSLPALMARQTLCITLGRRVAAFA